MKKCGERRRRRAPVAASLCLIFGSSMAAAQTLPCTKFFEPGLILVSYSWHDPVRWNPVGVPGPTDVACILADGMYDVDVTAPVAVAGFELNVASGTVKVKIVGTDFTLNGPAYLAQDTKLKVNDGAVLRTDGGGAIEVHSKLVVGSGTVEIDIDLYGHLNFEGTGSVTGTVTTHPGSVIELEEGATGGHLTIADGFDSHAHINLDDSAPQSLTVTSGSLVNTGKGTIASRPAGPPSTEVPVLRAELVNQGLVEVDGLNLRLAGGGAQHSNSADGTIQVTGADFEIDLSGAVDVPSNFTNHGTVVIGGGTSVIVAGTTGDGPEDLDAVLINYGTIDIESGGTLEFIGAGFDNPAVGRIGGTGLIDVSQASLVTFDGTVSPGWSPGIFTIEGSIGVGSNTRLEIELGGQSPGVNQDRLDVTGNLGIDGVLDVSLIDPYHPVEGDVFEILTYAQLSGWFSLLDLPVLSNLLAWNPLVGGSSLQLEVVCAGTQIGIASTADRDPVSVGYELVYHATVGNPSSTGATQLVITDSLSPSLSFRGDLSSPECTIVGSTVECSRATLAPQETWDVLIGADVMVVGQIDNTLGVSSWECDTNPGDNAATVSVNAVLADPCDANYDLTIDADDLDPTVGFIFGGTVAGNPDCRLGDGVTADDLAAIVEEAQ